MTHPQLDPSIVDVGNPLLSGTPCMLFLRVITGPDGQPLLAHTIRDAANTHTVFLGRDEVDDWIGRLTEKRARMAGLLWAPPGDGTRP